MSVAKVRPKGIFNRGTVGAKTSPVIVEIERGRVDFFVKTIGETNPVHLYRSAAKEMGYDDVVVPLTYPIVISMLANAVLEGRGERPLFELIGSDFRRLLHGEERYEYEGTIHVGDSVIVQGEVCSFADKKSGALEVATLRTVISHSERGKLVTMTSTAIHRLA